MSDARGFTLVETLVAALLMTIMLLGAAAMMLSSVSHLDVSGEETTASTLAQQRIEWLRNQGYTAAALSAGGSTETLTGNYAGYTRSTLIEDGVPRSNVKRVTITTSTPSGRSVQIIALIATGV